MIAEALNFFAKELNDYIRQRFGIDEDKVVLSAICNQDGTIAVQGDNKILVTLINLEENRSVRNPDNFVRMDQVNTGRRLSGPLYLNLRIVISAYFLPADYSESLKFISAVFDFLYQNPVFTSATSQRLPKEIERLDFESEFFDDEKLKNTWGMLGAKYMPSVIYRVRMITISDVN